MPSTPPYSLSLIHPFLFFLSRWKQSVFTILLLFFLPKSQSMLTVEKVLLNRRLRPILSQYHMNGSYHDTCLGKGAVQLNGRAGKIFRQTTSQLSILGYYWVSYNFNVHTHRPKKGPIYVIRCEGSWINSYACNTVYTLYSMVQYL